MEVATPPEKWNEADELETLIQNEARRVQAEFRTVTDSADRHRLQKRYTQLDRWMGVLNAIDAMPDAEEAATLKRALRSTAMETLRRWRNEGVLQQRHHHDLEARRRQIRDREQGTRAGENRRIRQEIEQLLRNYTKSNDSRIEALVNKWRRSGDPSYDPGVMSRLQAARKKKGNSDYSR